MLHPAGGGGAGAIASSNLVSDYKVSQLLTGPICAVLPIDDET